jgi:hypothetical protein
LKISLEHKKFSQFQKLRIARLLVSQCHHICYLLFATAASRPSLPPARFPATSRRIAWPPPPTCLTTAARLISWPPPAAHMPAARPPDILVTTAHPLDFVAATYKIL